MAHNRLTFKLEGKRQDDGYVRVADFVRFLEEVLSALRRIESDLTAQGSTVFRVRSLGTGSAIVEVEAVGRKNRPDRSERVVETFMSSLRALQSGGELPRELDALTVEALGEIVSPLQGSVAKIEIIDGDVTLELTELAKVRAQRFAARDYAAEAAVSGYVDALNVHENLVFYLYPTAISGKIACHFSRDLLDNVRQAVKRYVTAHGRALYRSGAVLPHRVDVEKITIHPPSDQLPRLRSLMGVFPDLTGGMESVEYLRQQRNAAG